MSNKLRSPVVGIEYKITDEKQLGHLLRSARLRMGKTQGNIAPHLGIGQRRVSTMEKEPANITVGQLMVWLNVMGLELVVREKQGPTGNDLPNNGVEW
jgi:HTH-type transcriptional regulator/antitoxin HipB